MSLSWTFAGLSPRRRGNRRGSWAELADRGPIPAQAGEPERAAHRRAEAGAYPRAGGGTIHVDRLDRAEQGLSPRRRGNRGPAPGRPGRGGPIPAQAGEPTTSGAIRSSPRAYPRAGGGTIACTRDGGWATGLSPRRRGNRRAKASRSAKQGPIPAQAGEPSAARPQAPRVRAYPRAGGGTANHSAMSCSYTGLSPRQAGEPVVQVQDRITFGAYPRAGGGT